MLLAGDCEQCVGGWRVLNQEQTTQLNGLIDRNYHMQQLKTTAISIVCSLTPFV